VQAGSPQVGSTGSPQVVSGGMEIFQNRPTGFKKRGTNLGNFDKKCAQFLPKMRIPA
jgi:hypothetical protein